MNGCRIRVGLSTLLMSMLSCVPLPPSKPKPVDATHNNIDFTALFTNAAFSRSASYYTASAEHGVRRVAVSPNLVFETSHTGIKEPEPAGPQEEGGGDAQGKAIQSVARAPFLAFLGAHQLEVFPPAAARAFGGDVSCGARSCGDATWFERWLMVFRTSTAKQLEDAPTVAIAVREFGIGSVKLDVVVTTEKDGALSATVADPTKPSACAASAAEFPAFVLRAEVLSLKDGHLIAHIDESRPLQPVSSLKRNIVTTTLASRPVKDASGEESLVSETTDVTCENMHHELDSLIAEVGRSKVARLAAEELLRTGLGPVFR
jgi:hypothetical protein